jgi:hypothetical protein
MMESFMTENKKLHPAVPVLLMTGYSMSTAVKDKNKQQIISPSLQSRRVLWLSIMF